MIHVSGRETRWPATIEVASAVGGYVGKPRPVVIVQDDRFAAPLRARLCVHH